MDLLPHDPEEDWAVGSIPTKRAVCPQCGRRVKLHIGFCHDGCCVVYTMPQHKVKGWYKLNKVKRKNSRDKVGGIRC